MAASVKIENSKAMSVSQLKNLIDQTDSQKEVLWDMTVDRYVNSIKKAKIILDQESIKPYTTAGLFKNLDIFVNRCKSPEFHIAFVGAIKAGKSTLINALLGKDLASISVTPETAALTKFRSSKTTNFIKLTFYTSFEWEQLWNSVQSSKAEVFIEEYTKLNADNEKNNWLNHEELKIEIHNDVEFKEQIKKWTSSKAANHYFVKEVEVGLTDFLLPDQVVFVDTPGLDDPVKYRSDITREYIDRANAVLVCVKSDALTGGELATIYSVFANTRYNPEKVYVVGTQMDTLNRPEENWREQRQEWLKHLAKQDCYGSLQLAEKNLIGTASHFYTLLSNYQNLDEDSHYEVLSTAFKFRISNIDEHIDRLLEFTKIDLLKKKLENEIIIKHKQLLLEDLKQNYSFLKEELALLFQSIKQNQAELLEAANGNIEDVRKKREESLRLLQESEQEKEDLTRMLKQLKLLTTRRAEELYSTIRGLGGK
jgi:GTPase SAR1 family protein